MVSKKLADRFKKTDGFVYPRYNGFSLPNLSNTIMHLLGVAAGRPLSPTLYESVVGERKPKKIILFLLDGFGYKDWLKYYKHFAFFKALSEKGKVCKITSTFPSTTACAITSVNTGLLPVQHELPEWQVYSERLDDQIDPLPFISLSDSKKIPIEKGESASEYLFRGKSMSQRLAAKRIKTYIFQSKSIITSPYSLKLSKKGIAVPYYTLADLFVNLRQRLEKEKGKAYFYVYISEIDSIEHHYGPYTEYNYAIISLINHLIQTEFIDKLDKKAAADTLLILSADHGQINIPHSNVIYLNRFKWLAGMFETGKRGRSITPTGSPRDVFLHIKPDMLVKAKELLGRALKSKAVVYTMDELVAKGVFGNQKPRKKFLNKLGNLAILPRGNNTVWWKYGDNANKFIGMHGNLSEEEMLIPLSIVWLDKLLRNKNKS
ncbi:MAG: alkaline phosphatase family protein [Candidatus Micrarchaeia archaeon]